MDLENTETINHLAPEQLEQEIRRLDWRDLQLWCIALLVLTVVVAGFMCLIIPQILWKFQSALAHQEDAPQLVFGLIMLLILLNVYLFQQRHMLLRTRQHLIVQLQIAERTARTDVLTGIYNRRFMGEALTREMARADRNQTKLCVILIDIDGFKEFNTNFGHLTGDRVLIQVAALLLKNFRASDFVTRFGGDEFLIIAPETDLSQAKVAIERLTLLLERWNSGSNREFVIRVCSGLAAYIAGMTVEDMLKAADADLYVQKALRKRDTSEIVLENAPFGANHPDDKSGSSVASATEALVNRKARILL